MAASVRVLVIGAGVAGLSAALELTGLVGYDTTVIDRGGPGFGSSSRSAGVVETQYLHATDISVRAFGLRYFERFAEDYGIELVRDGYLRLGAAESDLDEFARSVEIQRDLGIKDAVVLKRQEIEQRWPRLVLDGRSGALFGPSDGHVDGYEFCLRAAALLVRRGGQLRTGVTAVAAKRTDEGAWAVTTSAGVFEADVVVNAAGPWAQQVGDLLGCPVPLNNQLRPKALFSHSESLDQPLPFVMDYVPSSGLDGIYFRSEGPTNLFVGIHTDESLLQAEDPDSPLGDAPQSFLDRVAELLPLRLRVPQGLQAGRTWTGLYPISPDNKPVVGLHPSDSTVGLALGAGGSGIQLAPAMGRHLVDLITERPATFPGLNWGLERFPDYRLAEPAA